ncbi:hypothetical protein [Archaeoglobus sulfaticallidus]|nr:hypothetical protein [Archaeoglobus sulfaticallidus]
MLTKSGSSKSKLQRVDLNTFRRIDEIKKRYQRRSFNDTLEFLLNCYDFLEGIAIRYNLGDIKSATEFIENHLPKSQAEVIHQNVFDLIKKTGINGEDAEVLIDHFLQTLILVKLRRKRAIEVLRPFLVVRGGSP